MVYTTNAIASLHMQLRGIIKTNGYFPSDEATTKLRWLGLRAILAHSVTPLKWGWGHSISLDPSLPLGLVSSLSVTGRSKPHSPMPRDWISTGVIEGPSKRPYVHIYVGIGITSAGQR